MATSSLTKFTVPLATNQSASTQGMLMPKLKYRFRVSFENFGVSSNVVELTKQIKTAGRPKPSFDTVEVHVYNSIVKYAGKPKWEPINVVFRDDNVGNVSKLIGEQLQKQYDFMEQSSAASGINYKFVTRVEVLDGGNGQFQPNVLETWEMNGCFVNNAARYWRTSSVKEFRWHGFTTFNCANASGNSCRYCRNWKRKKCWNFGSSHFRSKR